MSLPLFTKDSRRTVVCSVDPCVVMKALPQTDDEKAKNAPLVREKRRPARWLDVDGEVDHVLPGATRVTYRPLDSDETFELTGGVLLVLADKARLFRAQHLAPLHAVVHLETTDEQGTLRVASTPEQVRELVPIAIKPIYRDPLGGRILDESLGYTDPLLSSE